MQYFKIAVKGRVQGVSFRFYTQQAARQFSITGTVRNHADGYVEIQAAAEEQNMQAFVEWCHKGPALAEVTHVTLTPSPGQPLYTDFKIIA